MEKCIIFSASEINDYSYISADGFIIAADGGLCHTDKLGITPNIIIGDMDSLGTKKVPDDALIFPTKKDDTDTLLAIKKGLSLGYKEFIIYGGLGGRLDHTVANIQSLLFLIENGATGTLISEKEEVFILKNESICIDKDCKYISVFGYDGDAFGVTIKGGEYPLNDGTVTSVFPIGISNKKVSKEVFIEVKDGKLLVILEK